MSSIFISNSATHNFPSITSDIPRLHQEFPSALSIFCGVPDIVVAISWIKHPHGSYRRFYDREARQRGVE